MRKTGTKWRTDKCARCERAHSGYSGKLDAKGIEYVVCGSTHKRMNVHPNEGEFLDRARWATKWVEEIAKVT